MNDDLDVEATRRIHVNVSLIMILCASTVSFIVGAVVAVNTTGVRRSDKQTQSGIVETAVCLTSEDEDEGVNSNKELPTPKDDSSEELQRRFREKAETLKAVLEQRKTSRDHPEDK